MDEELENCFCETIECALWTIKRREESRGWLPWKGSDVLTGGKVEEWKWVEDETKAQGRGGKEAKAKLSLIDRGRNCLPDVASDTKPVSLPKGRLMASPVLNLESLWTCPSLCQDN